MNLMPGENFAWKNSTAEPNPQPGPNSFVPSSDYPLDYAVHNLTLPSAQPLIGADLSVLGGTHDTTKPYATNWSLFDNFNLSSHHDYDSVNYTMEPAHRIRMNSMASSASSQSYSLVDDKKNYHAHIPQEVSEMYLACNTSYQPPFQSSYDTTNPSQYDDRVAPQPYSMHPVHPGGHGPPSSYSFGGYPQIYVQSFDKTFSTKTPAHSLDRPYKCDKCSASFSRNHDLKRHSRIHLDIKPFPCSFCDKAFARKDALKRHIQVKRCSKSTPREGHQNSDKKKISQPPSILAAKRAGEQDRLQRSSPNTHRISASEQQSSPIRVSETTAAWPDFNQIKLQNIQCSMPTFI
ncbi:hypothetical protein PCANC_13750 [Puccinia coronata f. sp. avenae]|uniref:C2H2-type domain-containing protein n=1 Tax=Puccinia coronata f. sp. avenae TaxID=200324 RepID=A0A2N5SWG7_9BASI|nr:hypothetical protein PCANC_13750 [Puccinia coronata f. sp. avenae]